MTHIQTRDVALGVAKALRPLSDRDIRRPYADATPRMIERLTDRFPVCLCRSYTADPLAQEDGPAVCERCLNVGAMRGKPAAECHRLTAGWMSHRLPSGVFVGPTEWARLKAVPGRDLRSEIEADLDRIFGTDMECAA